MQLDLPDDLADRLEAYSRGLGGTEAQIAFDRAVNLALDDCRWPRGTRGSIAVRMPDNCDGYYFVNIWDKHNTLLGHVGPIYGSDKARKVAAAWRKAKYHALHTARALGRPMTNVTS